MLFQVQFIQNIALFSPELFSYSNG